MSALDKVAVQELAGILWRAEQSREAAPPLTELRPDIDIDDAYAVQLVNVERAVKKGYVISGKKIGLTSPGIRRQMGVGEPDYGHLFEAMDIRGGRVETSALIQPKIEGELAFVLKKELSGGSVTADDVKQATDYVVAAFEIVDSRVANWNIKLADTVADNASSGRYILGNTKLPADAVELRKVSMKLYQNSELVGVGTGSEVLGDPCEAVAWLANCLWRYGVRLGAGEVILSGAFSAAPPARAGDSFYAEFTDFGTVTAEFI